MRLRNIPPAELSAQQRPLFETIGASIAAHLKGFTTARDDGALIGPFNILLHFPELGTSVWGLFKALADQSSVPAPVRELTILLTGAKLGATYESYSHENVALSAGMSLPVVGALAIGQRPAGLSEELTVAFDLVQALLRGGPMPGSTYRLATQHFGEDGLAEIACTIGCYTAIATLLNVFDVAVPEGELTDDGRVNGR